MTTPDLYIIGATTRATADMARRAGFSVGCFDAYGDVDLVENNAWTRLISFLDGEPDIPPGEFRAIVGHTPWLYTGPLENSPEWLAQAAEGTNLWGNSAQTCRAVRDPFALAEYLSSSGSQILMPEIKRLGNRPRQPNRWLFKPTSGTGGWETVRARRVNYFGMPRSQNGSAAGYLQKFIPGRCFGVTVASDGLKCVLLGICESARGAPGRPYAYSGSSGPIRSSRIRRVMPRIDELSKRLTTEYRLKGLWNLDLVCSARNDRWYLLEINPRPSASMEVLELAIRQELFVIQRKIFLGDDDWYETAKEIRRALESTEQLVEKIVIYAERRVRECRMYRHILNRSWGLKDSNCPDSFSMADLPQEGTAISSGAPIMTIYGYRSQRKRVLSVDPKK